MRSRSTLGSAAAAVLALSTLVVACSTSNSGGTGTNTSGLVPETDAGFAGCEPIEQGCYTVSGTYPLPTTSATCASPGGPATGTADAHCNGVAPQAISGASCSVTTVDAGATDTSSEDGGAAAAPTPGACGENSGDYGTTMYGSSGKDDDCKYAVSYTTSPLCENDGTYFVVTANELAGSGGILTGACTYAEACLNDTHPAPAIDSRPPAGAQHVVEGPPGTYTIGPVVFDAPGNWTVRFHFNEQCCDVADDSPHGHAAFFVNVP